MLACEACEGPINEGEPFRIRWERLSKKQTVALFIHEQCVATDARREVVYHFAPTRILTPQVRRIVAPD